MIIKVDTDEIRRELDYNFYWLPITNKKIVELLVDKQIHTGIYYIVVEIVGESSWEWNEVEQEEVHIRYPPHSLKARSGLFGSKEEAESEKLKLERASEEELLLFILELELR